MKLKLSILIISAFIMSIFSISAVANSVVLFCPSPSQIIIKDIYSGTAQSEDGVWTGVSAIPPEDKDNWRSLIDTVEYQTNMPPYGNGNACEYRIGSIDAIDLKQTEFPNYNLYNITQGTQTVPYCNDQSPSQTPLQDPTSAHPCYYYKNPVM